MRARGLILWLGVWTSVVVIMATVFTVERRVPLGPTLLSAAVGYYTLGLIGLVVANLAGRWHRLRWSSARLWAAHLALAVCGIACWWMVNVGYSLVTVGGLETRRVVTQNWLFQLFNTVLIYGAMVAVILAVQAERRSAEQQRREAELRALAREIELKALRSQLEPHFLFNALNSVLSLIDTHPADARVMLTRVSDLLRAMLDRIDEQFVPLSREMELMENYLSIERVRFGDRLEVDVASDPALAGTPVPPLVLQPLVENAIKHGVAGALDGASIRITTERRGASIALRVFNTGQASGPSSADGRGLDLTRRRLATLYGDAASLVAEPEGDGFAATILIPVSAPSTEPRAPNPEPQAPSP